jgi:PKD repeat protein
LTGTAVSDQGTSNSDTAVLTIIIAPGENQPPVVTAVADQTIAIGETVSGILAAFVDPDAADTHTAVIDWGDGTVTAGIVDQAARTVSGSHTFAAVGTYTVTVTVTDNHGGVGSDTLQIAVSPNQLYLPVILNNP